jgi:hypothetical protein
MLTTLQPQDEAQIASAICMDFDRLALHDGQSVFTVMAWRPVVRAQVAEARQLCLEVCRAVGWGTKPIPEETQVRWPLYALGSDRQPTEADRGQLALRAWDLIDGLLKHGQAASDTAVRGRLDFLREEARWHLERGFDTPWADGMASAGFGACHSRNNTWVETEVVEAHAMSRLIPTAPGVSSQLSLRYSMTRWVSSTSACASSPHSPAVKSSAPCTRAFCAQAVILAYASSRCSATMRSPRSNGTTISHMLGLAEPGWKTYLNGI